MTKALNLVAGALVAVSLALPAFAQDQTEAEAPEAMEDPNPATVAVTVNGVEITLGHMIVAMASLPEQYQQLDDQTLYDGILRQLVQQEALAQTFDESLPPRVVYSLENEQRSLLAGEVVNMVMDVDLDESRIQEFYDERYGSIEAEEEFNASHILVESEEEAMAVKQALDDGGNFAQIAREKSVGPSGPGGGELGWFKSGMMVPPFEAAAIALEVGEVSDPVQTTFGWHVIILNDVRRIDVPTFEEKRAEIESEMRREIGNAALDAAVDGQEVVVTPVDGWTASVVRRLDLLQ